MSLFCSVKVGAKKYILILNAFRQLLWLFTLLYAGGPASRIYAQALTGSFQNMATDSSGLVIGIDISNHQGTIKWEQVKQQSVKFAYVKATEGRTVIDKKFTENFNGSRKAGIATGAYHFFLFRVTGREQADHFIKNVPYSPGDLPPAVDIEIFSNQYLNLSDRAITAGIQVYINKLFNHYGVWPLIYTDNITYRRFIKGRFLECPLWICDLKKEPQLEDKRAWIFWQFAHTGRIKGIAGNVDMNVFRGSGQDLNNFIKQTGPK